MDEATTPQQKDAQDNPWYRLATLHGEPANDRDWRVAKNRETWNRWMAPRLSEELKTALREKGWSDQELTPFSEDERQSIAAQVGSLEADRIDFSATRFAAEFFAQGFVFLDADFRGATFSRRAFFESATFSETADFWGTTFSSFAFFGHATFSSFAFFHHATFSENAHFESATVGQAAGFASVTFSGNAYFASATFSGPAFFDSTTFSGTADFVNAEMKGPTTFDDVKFSQPPRCFNAKLHEETTWHGVRWPKTPSDASQARAFRGAYERLKLEMDRLKKHGDELDFFARELQCQRVVLGWKGLPIALYGALCGHGRYYMRPLGILVAVVILGAVPIRAHFGGGWSIATFTEHPIGGGALGLSFANTFGFLGTRKDMIDPGLLQGLPGWLKVVATVQTILGIVLLFLFGLGIRNRFRIK